MGDFVAAAGTLEYRGQRIEHVNVLIPEKSVSQCIDVSFQHFLRFQGRSQCGKVLPCVFFFFIFLAETVRTGLGWHLLQKQAPDDVLVGSQLDTGVQLFGLLHVIFNDV